MDYDLVHQVRASLLGLDAGTVPSEADSNTSTHFIPTAAASEKEPLEVVTPHWLPILEKEGRLADCPPGEFTATGDWVPLYIPDNLRKHLPVALAAYGTTNPPSLAAVVPPELSLDGEFLLMNFHHRECLMRPLSPLEGNGNSWPSALTVEFLTKTLTQPSVT